MISLENVTEIKTKVLPKAERMRSTTFLSTKKQVIRLLLRLSLSHSSWLTLWGIVCGLNLERERLPRPRTLCICSRSRTTRTRSLSR